MVHPTRRDRPCRRPGGGGVGRHVIYSLPAFNLRILKDSDGDSLLIIATLNVHAQGTATTSTMTMMV